MKKISLMLLVYISFLSCTHSSSKQDWYLKGGDVHLVLDWPQKRILLEDTSGMIFSGIILSQSNKGDAIQIHIRMDSVGEVYKDKYLEDMRDDFVIWLEYGKKSSLKVLINQISTKPYFFVSDFHLSLFTAYKQGRYLSDGEINTFFKDNNNYYNLAGRYTVNIIPSVAGQMQDNDVITYENTPNRRWLKDKYKVPNYISIKQMTDYLKDMDPSSGFITKDPVTKLQLEYILNNNKNSDIFTPLVQPVPIRAVLINTGNLDYKQDFRRYRRPKKLVIYFSSQYSGGLGNTRGNYNEQNLVIELTDEPKTHLIVFYQAIYAKVISVNVDSYYLGDKDEMALFDLVFFGDSL